ncbi:MAG: PDZ domain-containing protein [Phycisphaerales bacterium JB038]
MNRRLHPFIVLFSLLVVLLTSVSAPGQLRQRSDPREAQALERFRARDYEEARDLLLAVVADDESGEFATARYNLACAYAQLGELDAAVESLRAAVDTGYLNLHQIKRDRDLRPLRRHNAYIEFLDAWPTLVEQATGERIRDAMGRLGGGYITESDEAHRLIYVTALDLGSHSEMKGRIAGLFDAAIADLFGAGLDVPVLVVVPNPTDYRRLVRAYNIGGLYLHDHYQLISRTTGGNLQHELIHALHWADMDRLGQRHPIWIQEGIAAVFEDIELVEGRVEPKPSWRTNIVKRLARINSLTPIDDLAGMSRNRFMDFRPQRNYAEARAVFMYLESLGKFGDWYEAYTASFDQDPSGLRAIEEVTGKTPRELQKDYAAWVKALPEVQEIVTPGGASLGVVVNDREVNDGVVIKDVQPGSGAAEAGLEPGDIIISLNNERVASIRDLTRALGMLDVGNRVRLRLRRDGDYLSRYVELTPR